MQKKNRKFLIYGILGIVVLVVTYFGIGFLKGSQLFKNTSEYYVYYDRVDGLNTSSLVQVNGYKIGKVSKIELLPEKDCKLLVTLELQNDYPIPDSSVAAIVSTDIMGTKGIEMRFSDKTTYHKAGDFLLGQTQENLKDQISAEVLPVKKAVEDLMVEITDVIDIVSGVFNEDTRQNLEESFASLRNSLVHLEHSVGHLDNIMSKETDDIVDILANVKTLSDSLAASTDDINNFINNISTFSDTLTALHLTKTVNEVNSVVAKVNDIVDKVNRGEGTLGELIHDNTLALQVENAAMNLDKLLTDIRIHPKKYINLSVLGGKSYYVTDEGYLSDKDLERMKQQQEKDLQDTEKELQKEMKSETKTGLYFAIQILSSQSKADMTSREFKSHNDVVEIHSEGRYRYFLYPHSNPKYTNTYLKDAKADFPEAFPVAIEKGKVILYDEGRTKYNSKQ